MLKVNKLLSSLLIVISAFLIFSSPLCGGVAIGYAATSSVYSNVLDDLKKDSNFSESHYPKKTDDYSLQVIQLAESSDNELFVYVYQPSGETKDFTASSINISTKKDDFISFNNYKLIKCNSSGVFYKYVVKDFTVLDVPTRYYVITSIYRPFEETIDTSASDGNVITEVDYPVAKQYCFSEINGQPFVSVVDIQTIEITDKFVGFVRYDAGFNLYNGACDSHFVAFNTDRPIDKLLEADVYYTKQSYSWTFAPIVGASSTYGDKSDNYAYLKYDDDKVIYKGDGLFAPTHKWDTIETVEQFIAENEGMENVYSGAILNVNAAYRITDEGKRALQGKKWVLRFSVTDYKLIGGATGTGSTSEFSTLVGDVTILRLKFETDGITYNLGTIDNKQTGSNNPINEEQINVTLTPQGKRLSLIAAIIALILLFVMLYPVLSPVLGTIVKGLIWLITAPFKALARLIKNKKE